MLTELEEILRTSKPGNEYAFTHSHVVKLVEQLKDHQRLLLVEQKYKLLLSQYKKDLV